MQLRKTQHCQAKNRCLKKTFLIHNGSDFSLIRSETSKDFGHPAIEMKFCEKCDVAFTDATYITVGMIKKEIPKKYNQCSCQPSEQQ